jgi:tellurite resistance protein
LVVVLWNWWNRAGPAEQERLRDDVAVLSTALWAAAADGRLDGPSEEAASARHLLRALDRLAAIVRLG